MKHKSGQKKIRVKILKIFILISIIPLLIISFSSLYVVIKTRQQNIAELQNLAIDNAADKITKFLNQKKEGLNLVVGSQKGGSAINKLSQIDTNQLIFLATSAKQASGKQGINKLSFVNRDGDVIIEIDQNDRTRVKYSAITGELQKLPGNVIPDSTLNTNISDRPDFKTAISGNDYFGPVESIDNKLQARVAAQIINQQKNIIGIISAEIDLAAISSLIKQIQLGNTGYIYVVNKNGDVIASSNKTFAQPGQNLKSASLVYDVITNNNAYNGLEKFTSYVNHLNEEVIFAGRPMEYTEWSILSEWPRKDAFSIINNILNLTILITLGTFILIIALGIFFTNQITKPINSLWHGAKHISRGDYGYRIRLKTGDEFEDLGNKFNEMIKILKENQKLRDEFVFISAHELRTPVTAIKGYLSMILDNSFGKVPEKIKENLDIINASNERLVQLVHDLLEIARSEAGKIKIDLINSPMKENVTTVINELKSLAGQKNIKLIYEDKYADTKIKTDPYKLKEVLTNLIGNAIKYTLDNGDITISHEIRGKSLITRIKDHGMGMSEEDRKKLFSKFFRIQNEKTAEIEGTGLGLFICKEIIERMNGKIWVKSEVGKGSAFNFSLGLAK